MWPWLGLGGRSWEGCASGVLWPQVTAFQGGGRSWWSRGGEQDVFPPPLPCLVLLHPLTEAPLSAGHGVDTVCINKIPFWPVCVSASAKSCFEAGSDKTWLSRERAQTG